MAIWFWFSTDVFMVNPCRCSMVPVKCVVRGCQMSGASESVCRSEPGKLISIKTFPGSYTEKEKLNVNLTVLTKGYPYEFGLTLVCKVHFSLIWFKQKVSLLFPMVAPHTWPLLSHSLLMWKWRDSNRKVSRNQVSSLWGQSVWQSTVPKSHVRHLFVIKSQLL